MICLLRVIFTIAFLTKFSVFIAVGLLSIIPTVEFLSWRGAIAAGQVPVASAKKMEFVRNVHGELLALVIILLCAAIVARGGWV